MTRVSAFNIFSIAKPPKFEKKDDGHILTGNMIPLPSHTYGPAPRATVAADIR